jgi:hypothetical protein
MELTAATAAAPRVAGDKKPVANGNARFLPVPVFLFLCLRELRAENRRFIAALSADFQKEQASLHEFAIALHSVDHRFSEVGDMVVCMWLC